MFDMANPPFGMDRGILTKASPEFNRTGLDRHEVQIRHHLYELTKLGYEPNGWAVMSTELNIDRERAAGVFIQTQRSHLYDSMTLAEGGT